MAKYTGTQECYDCGSPATQNLGLRIGPPNTEVTHNSPGWKAYVKAPEKRGGGDELRSMGFFCSDCAEGRLGRGPKLNPEQFKEIEAARRDAKINDQIKYHQDVVDYYANKNQKAPERSRRAIKNLQKKLSTYVPPTVEPRPEQPTLFDELD